jgi:hypothetical protein
MAGCCAGAAAEGLLPPRAPSQASAIAATQITTSPSVIQKKKEALARWIWSARRKGIPGSRRAEGSSGMRAVASTNTRRAKSRRSANDEAPNASARPRWPFAS